MQTSIHSKTLSIEHVVFKYSTKFSSAPGLPNLKSSNKNIFFFLLLFILFFQKNNNELDHQLVTFHYGNTTFIIIDPK